MNRKSVESEMVVCPNCGTELSSNAKVCHNCGSDENTGWSEQTYLDGLGIPFEDEYDEFKSQEFKTKRNKKINWIAAIGVILLVVFALMIFRF